MRKIGIFDLIPDKPYLKLMYRLKMGKPLDLKNPVTYNEKLQWLKLYDRNPEYYRIVDKYEAKSLIAEKIGSEHIIPTLGVWNQFDDIDFSKLPNQFVLKTTHDSGGIAICRDKSTFDKQHAKSVIEGSLNRCYFKLYREWAYKNVKPRIIAEKYMENADGSAINDYKLLCFNGKVDNIMVCVGRFSADGVKYHFFDRAWKYLPYCPYEGINADNVNVPRPDTLDEMIKIAEILSNDFPQARIDLYEICGTVYFGEITLYPQSGFDTDITPECDILWGTKLKIK